MSPQDAALFWLSTYAQVLLLGFQSRNVNEGRYLGAACTSFLVGTAQLFVIRGLAGGSPFMAWSLTCTAGPLGITSAMLLYRRLYGKAGKARPAPPTPNA